MSTRPELSTISTGQEFNRWYWSKAQLVEACKDFNLSHAGSRAILRERIHRALDGLPPLTAERPSPKSRFAWAREKLSGETLITDNISFGPNVRRWFASRVGTRFICHSDFMDWVRGNVGATLEDAVTAWWVLEDRYDDPEFRREIAAHNTYLRYLRDIRDANPDMSLTQAKSYWHLRKIRPAPGGNIVYREDDLALTNGTD